MTALNDTMKATLARAGIPFKAIECYGSQIMVTCHGRDSAEKFASLISKFATIRRVFESRDYNEHNTNTTLKPSSHIVWRVAAVI